jgi:hypothetical protein
MLTDLTALTFTIPARDALGREHVEGKLVAAEDSLQFFWRYRERTFKFSRGRQEEMRMIPIDYANVESVIFRTTMFWFAPRLLLKLSDPRPLQEVPGTDVGLATVMLNGATSKADAAAFIKQIDFRKADAAASIRISRMSELEKERGL